MEKEGFNIVLLGLLHKRLCIGEPLLLAFRYHCRKDIFIVIAAHALTVIAMMIVNRARDTNFSMNDRLIVDGEMCVKSRRVETVGMNIVVVNYVSERIHHLRIDPIWLGEREGKLVQSVDTFGGSVQAC